MTEHFSVIYDGPALAEHRMPVTALAPALIAVSDMFMAAHRVTSDGATPPPSLDVQANREGSFAVELVLAAKEAVDLLSQPGVVATATAVTLLDPVVTALRYWRAARQQSSPPEIAQAEPGQIRIEWGDGTTYVGPASTQDLINSMDFRRSARAALAPLESDLGIDTVEIRPELESANVPPILLDRADAHGIDQLPADEDVISDVTRTVGLNPLKPSFEAGYKWWVSDGSTKFWVTMHDLGFMQSVESSAEAFSAGDILRCVVRDRQIRDAEGELRMEHTVIEVIDHLRRPPPDELPLED